LPVVSLLCAEAVCGDGRRQRKEDAHPGSWT
jgi:hypothetical protein